MEHNYYESCISLQQATDKLDIAIRQGLYGPSYNSRMRQLNPRIVRIDRDYFYFGMYKHYGLYRAAISPEIAAHWGINLAL